MPNELMPRLIFLAGIAQLCILIASSLVPFRLDWRNELSGLSMLHWQMYIIYGGYVVLSIIAFGLISLFNAEALADGSRLSRCFCAYMAIFWGVRLALQAVLDAKKHLTAWWLKLGYHTLTVLFATFTILYTWLALDL